MSEITTKRKPKTVVELFSYDLSTFFVEDDFDEISCDDTDDTFCVDYEKYLPWMEFNLFSKVQFRIFTNKHDFDGRSHINVVLPCKTSEVEYSDLKKFFNQLPGIYGLDDKGRGEMTDYESDRFGKIQIERFWTIGEEKDLHCIELIAGVNCIAFRILFFNNLLDNKLMS